ncbi:MAG: hypothetical protein ABR600_06340, partial [Actinomycetota bacterium]
MPATGDQGKRKATIEVQLVKEGNKIVMHLGSGTGRDYGAITFDARSGQSGNQAYSKLAEIIQDNRRERSAPAQAPAPAPDA